MYSESEIDAAVAAGIFDRRTADAFRDHVAQTRAAPTVDEEHFRLLTGFNDIFVSIAAVILLVAVGWIAGSAVSALAGFAVAGTSWGLAEYFTRTRRMALPSILLLLAFAGGIFSGLMALFDASDLNPTPERALTFAGCAAATAGAAYLHWRRFMVPITVAAGTAATVALALALAASAIPDAPARNDAMLLLSLIAGVAVFLFAMAWDGSDRERQTRRSDVAFWLHLLAAPLIVHPVFSLLGLLEGEAGIAEAMVVIAVYLILGFAALAVDRRALLVSALAYVLYAINQLFKTVGAVELSFALTALVIGSALLLLSAFWQTVRREVVGIVPESLRDRLPAVAPTVRTQPAS